MLSRRLKLVALSAIFAFALHAPTAQADSNSKVRFSFNNAELTQLIEAYSKASGRKFVIDPSVRGKATIISQEDVTLDGAFALLSTALESNGFAISDRGDISYISAARNVERSLIPLLKENPPPQPTRLAQMIITPKFANAGDLIRELRVLPSRDGEITLYGPTNSLLVTDWTPNLIRISEVVASLDQPERKGWAKDSKGCDGSCKMHDHKHEPKEGETSDADHAKKPALGKGP